MTRKQFMEAVHRGHGRAVIAVQSGEYEPLFRDLMKLVVRWPGYDYQLEPSREWYVVEIICATQYFDSFIDLAARFVTRKKGPRRNRRHRINVVKELARRGFPRAKHALYENFDPSEDLHLADEIIEIDGLAGLDWVLSHSKEHLSSENAWRFDSWIEEIEKVEAKETVSHWLSEASVSRPEVAEFVRLAFPKSETYQQRPIEKLSMSFEDILKRWQKERERYLILRWVRSANAEERQNSWNFFVNATDPDLLEVLSWALDEYPEKADIDKVIYRARHFPGRENPFAESLQNVFDPRVRQLGLDLLDGESSFAGLQLLAHNALPGDESLVLDRAQSFNDEAEIETIGHVIRDWPDSLDSRELLLWHYEMGACSFCRERTLELLIEGGYASQEILEESLFDCAEDTRNLAKKTLGATSGSMV